MDMKDSNWMLSLLGKLRELIQAEVVAGIADSEEDEDGYRGTGYAERKVADRVFTELAEMVKTKTE